MGSNLKQRFATQLWSLADLTRAAATRREFRSRAYRHAVWSLDGLSPDLGEPVDELLTVPGIGTGIARLISEFRENGEIGELGRLAESLPLEAGRLRLLPRMTPGRLRWLKSEVGVETVQDLIEAITLERLGGLKGVGAETARTWVDRSEWLSLPGMSPLAAHYWSSRLASHIERHVTGAEMIVTGSVRRLDEWVSEIDLVAAEDEGVVCFLEQSAVVTSVSQHPERSRFETLGATVNLYTPVPGTTAAAVFRTTGPTEHVEAVIESVGDREPVGLARTETDIYRTAGSTYIPPPARSGVLELPTALIGVEHLRGDLHLHSDWSPDGHQTIEELVHAARSKGLGYIAITDHAKGLRFGGLDEERIERQREAIEWIQPQYPDIKILHGSELNIDRNGEVDFDESVLERLDFTIAAVHSHFALGETEQTRRMLTAISNPRINVIAHLTGRRIGIRPPIDLDLEQVLAAAAEHGTALEVNGHLDRMDISADLVARARELGALFAADSDAHRPFELSNVAHSVGILQRGRVSHPEVINTWRLDDLLAWSAGRS